MTGDDILKATFTFTALAKRALVALRETYDAASPDDPAAILSVGWAYRLGADPDSGGLFMNFYPRSEAEEVAHGVQEVSGVPLIYFVTERDHWRFDGKVIDYDNDEGFVLREG